MQFADNTTIAGLISNNNETHYTEEVEDLAKWCSDGNLASNTTKTKEAIVDLRRSRKTTHPQPHLNGEEVERVDNIKFLGIHIQ